MQQIVLTAEDDAGADFVRACLKRKNGELVEMAKTAGRAFGA